MNAELDDGLENEIDPESSQTAPVIDPSVQANTTAVRIQKALSRLILTTVVLFVAICIMGVLMFGIARRNTAALCAVRVDAERRGTDNQQFLKNHPKGLPGLSPEVFKRSIESSANTVSALKNLHCPPPVLLVK